MPDSRDHSDPNTRRRPSRLLQGCRARSSRPGRQRGGDRGGRHGLPGRAGLESCAAGESRTASRPAGIGLHGRRAQEAGPRVRRHQPRLGVRRAARIAAQLRQQHEAGAADLPARGIGDGDGPRLRQGRGQADAGVRARRRRPAALVDGAVPGLGRSRADPRHRRPSPQSGGRDQPSAQRAGHGIARPRLREVRRRGDDARAVRGVGDAGVSHRDDAADGAGGARGRRRAAGVADRRSGAAAHSGAVDGVAAARRRERRPRSRAPAGERRDAADSNAEDGTHAEGLGPVGGAGRTVTGAGRRAGLCVVAVVPVVASALRLGRRGLHAGRDARPRSRRHVGAARGPRERTDARRSAFRPSTCFSTATSTTSGATPTSTWRLPPMRRRRCPSLIEESPPADDAGSEGGDRRRAARGSRRRTKRRT